MPLTLNELNSADQPMQSSANGYQPIMDILVQIQRAQDANALLAALSMVYIGIDTFAWLSTDKPHADRNSFIEWVNTYLTSGPTQPYQYDGLDVYAARCAFMHTYGSVSNLHGKANPPKHFGYLDNGPHQVDVKEPLVLISIAELIHDFHRATTTFLEKIKTNQEIKANVEAKIISLMATFDIGSPT